MDEKVFCQCQNSGGASCSICLLLYLWNYRRTRQLWSLLLASAVISPLRLSVFCALSGVSLPIEKTLLALRQVRVKANRLLSGLESRASLESLLKALQWYRSKDRRSPLCGVLRMVESRQLFNFEKDHQKVTFEGGICPRKKTTSSALSPYVTSPSIGGISSSDICDSPFLHIILTVTLWKVWLRGRGGGEVGHPVSIMSG